MQVVLIRHGDAVSEDVAGSDRDRWLSRAGRDAVRGLGRLLRQHGIAPDFILSSPLPRAVQTAERLADALDFLDEISVTRALEPSAQPRAFATQLGAYSGTVLVVAHEPIISGIGAVLVGHPSFPPFRPAQANILVDGLPSVTARPDLMQIVPLQLHDRA